jgi:hypothetical protein
MNAVRANTAAAAAATVIAVWTFVPAIASAQEYAKWYKQSEQHFLELKQKAGGGTHLTWDKLPDWTGIWTRQGGTRFDPSVRNYEPTTAKLTPEYKAKFEKKLADYKKGIEWDSLSYCLPAGFPRWLTEPFLREFIVRPEEVWWINEQQSEVRRIYIDGRGHVPEDEAYPLWTGDSIGFWDGDTLVVHTINNKEGQYNRGQPDYSEKVSVLEKIRKVDANTLEDDITVYDPLSLVEPWHVVNRFVRVSTPNLRINMWSCEENNNVVKSSDGATQLILKGEKGYKDPDQLIMGPEQAQAPKQQR